MKGQVNLKMVKFLTTQGRAEKMDVDREPEQARFARNGLKQTVSQRRDTIVCLSVLPVAALVAVLLILGSCGPRPATFTTTSVVFQGYPQGGEVRLFILTTTVTVETDADDTINDVARRVAVWVNSERALAEQGIKAQADGNRVVFTNLPEYNVYASTTDAGIAVPQEPRSLVCEVHKEDHVVLFRWQNPEGGYDQIHIVEGAIPIAERLPGNSTSFIHHYLKPGGLTYTGKHVYHVFGVTNQMPSNAAVCEVFLESP
jgi:hypothetical protein